MRLKGKSGSSVGPVKTVSVLDELNRTLTVSLHIIELVSDPSLHKKPHSTHKQTTLYTYFGPLYQLFLVHRIGWLQSVQI